MGSVFFDTYCSVIESKVLDLDLSNSLSKSEFVVNSHYPYLLNKKVIIDVVPDSDITELRSYCDLISRFPLENIPIAPYVQPADQKSVDQNSYSSKILNRHMINSTDLSTINEVADSNFLIGIDTDIDGYLTAVGYELLQTKLTDL